MNQHATQIEEILATIMTPSFDGRMSSLTFPASLLKGLELLYQPEVVRLYLSLLTCSHNHNTLEAAAGALQNLAAGHWAVSGLE